MLNIQKLLLDVMKKNIFSDTELTNKSARVVLGEIKTKFKDITEEMTPELQHKILSKMYNERMKSADIYINVNRIDLREKELTEASIIKSLLAEVEKDLPKQMTEEEIIHKINNIITNNPNVNIGIIMKEFKDLPADKALVSKLTKSILNNICK